jgi:asparagine synthase (glutamine-hydrolysing)
MRDSLLHRGPDDQGFVHIDKNIGFGHRRLSIRCFISRKPTISDDQRYVMVYNGEIYNFREFYLELKSKGHTIKTNSDTEVLLLYQLYGLKMLSRLNGMFALPFGIKSKKN